MALVGWWKLNQDSNDSTIYKNNGTVSNASLVNDGPLGGSYAFNGTNSYITFGNILNQDYSSFSISAWVNSTSTAIGNNNGIVYKRTTASSTDPGYRLNMPNGAFNLHIADGTNYVSLTAGSGYNDGKWHHVVGVVDRGNSLRIYVDGTLINSTACSLNTSIVSSVPLTIGALYSDGIYHSFNGNICDVRIYDHVLSIKEIRELTKCKILHYKMNTYQEPTNNIISTDFDVTLQSLSDGDTVSFYNQLGDGAYLGVASEITHKNGMKSLKTIATVEGGSTGRIYKTKSILAGEIVTFSVDCYSTVPGSYIRFEYNGGDYTWRSVNSSQHTGSGWERLTLTYDQAATSNTTCYYFCYPRPANQPVYWKNFQLEKKSYATSFVNGSRIGKVYDCSGFNHHSTLDTLSPQYDSSTSSYIFTPTKKINLSASEFVTPSEFSISFWMKSVTDAAKYVIGQSTSWFANGTGWFCGAANTAADMYFEVHNSTGRTCLQFNSGRTYDWSHFVGTYKNGVMKTYLNGVLKNSTSSAVVMDTPTNDFTIGAFPGHDVLNGDMIRDVRIYASELSSNDVTELYQTSLCLDKNGNLYTKQIKENKYVPPLIDYSNWVVGTSGSQTAGSGVDFYICGESACNSIVNDLDPWGNTVPIWQTLNNDTASDDDGGWNTSSFPIDNTKMYRFSVWVKRKVLGNGRFYLGCRGRNSSYTDIGVLYRNDGTTLSTNPYFEVNGNWSEWEGGGKLNKWYLVVGHVFPVGSGAGSSHPDSGIYDVNGNKVDTIEYDFIWTSDCAKTMHRTYLFYSTDPATHQLWCYPRVDVCDGTEPTIKDLINGIDYEHYKILKNLKTSKSLNRSSILINEVNEIGPASGLVGYWPLNGDTKDYSGNSNHGINNNAIVVQGLRNRKCYSFNGTNAWINCGNAKLLANNQISLSCWCYFNDLGAWKGIITKGINSGAYGIQLDRNGNNRLQFTGIYTSSQWVIGTTTLTTGNWYHLVATYSNRNVKLYVNGVEDISATVEWDIVDNNENLSIGCDFPGGDEYHCGLLQDVRIYNRALTAKEIKTLYNLYAPTSTQKLQINKENIVYATGMIKEVY